MGCLQEAPSPKANRVLRRDKKKQKFLDLVERFYLQLRNGCGNPKCQCPACISAKSPYRRPTPSSARAMAVLLASADNPYRHLCHHDSEQQALKPTQLWGSSDRPIDTRSFLQVLFNTKSWQASKTPKEHKYTFPPPLSPTHLTYSEKDSERATNPASRTRFLFMSDFGISPERSSLETIADRLTNDVGTSEALFRTFGTKGSPSGVIGRVVPYYNIDETIKHFVALREMMRGSELTFLSLYEDCAVAYLRPSTSQTKHPDSAQLGNFKAAHVINVCLGSLLSCFDIFWPDPWIPYLGHRRAGHILPSTPRKCLIGTSLHSRIVDCTWVHYKPLYYRLMRRLLRIIASRIFQASLDLAQAFGDSIITFIGSTKSAHNGILDPARVLLEWAQIIFQQSWDNEPVFSWNSDVGCAVGFMELLYKNRETLRLPPSNFNCHFLPQRLKMMRFPGSWIRFTAHNNQQHLLSFPWLFSDLDLVTYFRVINRSTMLNAFHTAACLNQVAHRPFRVNFLVNDRQDYISTKLGVALQVFLVLNIRRDNILEDAMTQLFSRQKREIKKPLKIRMGMEEGEEGVDMGGIQQEFFRLALGQALDPDHGMFSVDETTRMAWFYPGSKTPIDRFTLLGLMSGVAVYNGITLSVTFPLAFYRKLLGLPVDKLEHIRDGWPELTRGLQALLDYSGEDVEDVFMRSYVFSVEVNGTTWNIDISESKGFEALGHERYMPWPPSSDGLNSAGVQANSLADHAPMVTNHNRAQYVSDYIRWLTTRSIHHQWKAFEAGFFMCVEKKTLSLFTPETLKNLVEGSQVIDVDALESVTTYDNGFDRSHSRIEDFWDIVKTFSPVETRKLLEFVTASDRVPVKGIRDIAFSIIKNGDNDERLPTSMTCFSRLLLPSYSSRAILEEKLRQAIDNSLGFGVQ